jgi:hypothetical protein
VAGNAANAARIGFSVGFRHPLFLMRVAAEESVLLSSESCIAARQRELFFKRGEGKLLPFSLFLFDKPPLGGVRSFSDG